MCPLNLTMWCNTLCPRDLSIWATSAKTWERVMTHVQARTGCSCEQQILKHKISSGSYLLWGKFESLGTEEALKQEMPWQDGAAVSCSGKPVLDSSSRDLNQAWDKACPWPAAALRQQRWHRVWPGVLLAAWYQCKQSQKCPQAQILHIKLDNLLVTNLPLLVAGFNSFS